MRCSIQASEWSVKVPVDSELLYALLVVAAIDREIIALEKQRDELYKQRSVAAEKVEKVRQERGY
jgi:hypothetical protein